MSAFAITAIFAAVVMVVMVLALAVHEAMIRREIVAAIRERTQRELEYRLAAEKAWMEAAIAARAELDKGRHKDTRTARAKLANAKEKATQALAMELGR